MVRRRYKSKWQRYGTIIGVLLVGVGSVIMILLGVIFLLDQSQGSQFIFISTLFQIPAEFSFLWGIMPIICGIAILVIIVKQKPHEEDTLTWVIVTALLGIIGGTLGGLVVFGGALVYLLLYIL